MRTKTFFCSFLLLFALLSFPFLLFSQSKSVPEPNSLCGPNALLVAFQKLEVSTNLEEVKKLSGYDESKGTTMAGLYKAAKTKGLYAVGMKIGLDELSKLKIPIIAYLWDNHCVVIDGFEGNHLNVIDYPKEPYLITKDKFTGVYSGLALLISKNEGSFPKIEVRGPDIRFKEYIYNFGVVRRGKKVEHIFKFKNVGKEKLVIDKVRTPCSCTDVIFSKRGIPYQSEDEIKVVFDTAGYKGSQNQTVYVYSNDTVTPIVKLQVKGIVETELRFSPQTMVLEDIKKGADVIETLYINKIGTEDFKIFKVKTSSDFISVKIKEIANSITEYIKKFEIEIIFDSNIPFGNLQENLTIYTNDKEYPKIEIPIFGNIKRDIEFKPSSFFFGFIEKGEKCVSKLTIFTTCKGPFKIKEVENPFDCISVYTIPKNKNKEYEITAVLEENAPTGNIKGDIIFHTDNVYQPIIKVPVYGLIR